MYPDGMEVNPTYRAGDILVSPGLVQLAGLGLKFGTADSLFEYLDEVSRLIEIIVLYETPVMPLFTILQQQGALAEHFEDIKGIIKEPSESEYWQYEDKEYNESLLTCIAYANATGLSLIYDQDSINLLSWVYGDDFSKNLVDGISRMNSGTGVSTTNNLLNNIKERADETITKRNDILSRQYFSLEMPILFGYVTEKVRHVNDIIPAALELRDSKEARAFRRQLILLDEAIKIGNDKVVGSIIDELDNKIRELNTKIKQPTLGIQVSFPPSITIDTSDFWKYIAANRKPHLLFIEQLYKNSVQSRPIINELRKFS